TTLHTRDSASAISRLIDMGVEPFMIASAIDTVVAQRLARILCDQCKREANVPPAALAELGLEGTQLYEPSGCVRCNGSGYHGRVGLFEVMALNDEIRGLILTRASVREISDAAARAGMRTMYQDGLEKV